MSAHWGTQTLRKRVLFVLAALVIPLAGCEYSSPAEGPRQSSPQASTAQPRSFEENVDAVARLLEVSTSDPGMPSEAESAGELSIVLAPGDYMVKTACAGVHGAKLTIVKGEGLPEATPYTCDSTLNGSSGTPAVPSPSAQSRQQAGQPQPALPCSQTLSRGLQSWKT